MPVSSVGTANCRLEHHTTGGWSEGRRDWTSRDVSDSVPTRRMFGRAPSNARQSSADIPRFDDFGVKGWRFGAQVNSDYPCSVARVKETLTLHLAFFEPRYGDAEACPLS